MEEYFSKFLAKIKLTANQRLDAKNKYSGVCKILHEHYYTNKYDGKTKLLIGSYGKKTNIRPARDIDLIFKMPDDKFEQYDNHESNGQSNLLSKIKNILGDKYPSSSIKAFGKVVVVEFSNSRHNVEVLPSFEQDDGTFKIPNSADGGSWEVWDPRNEIEKINSSDSKSNGNTRKLVRMIKKWEELCSVKIKSYQIEDFVMQFLDDNNYEFTDTQELVKDFFSFLIDEIDESQKSFAETAQKRAQKAIDYYNKNKELKAVSEWKKIFGSDFPSQGAVKSESKDNRYYSDKEEFIEEIHEVSFNDIYFVKINCYVRQDGWRTRLLRNMPFLLKRKKLEFFVESTNIPEPYSVKWKVRNYGEEALRRDDLRGQIWPDTGKRTRTENSKYMGTHYVECYIIKDNRCIAYDNITVSINNQEEADGREI
ncbi:MAG: DNA polymerase III subunit delta' [Melioribacteraceae bacterium]|nr:MAG: DNA polymerase III subunit delta' [Melioribacteraceae bacterium]